jgi:hypothetical protein
MTEVGDGGLLVDHVPTCRSGITMDPPSPLVAGVQVGDDGGACGGAADRRAGRCWLGIAEGALGRLHDARGGAW